VGDELQHFTREMGGSDLKGDRGEENIAMAVRERESQN